MIYRGTVGIARVLVCLLETESLLEWLNGNIIAEHLEEVSGTDPRGTEQKKYNNATVSHERFSR